MSFRTVCFLAVIATAPFGLMFLLAPQWLGALYGLDYGTPGSAMLGRLYGAALLLLAGLFFAMSDIADSRAQQRTAAAGCFACALGALVSVHATLTGVTNALMWSTAVLYGFFVVAWAVLRLRQRSASEHQLA
jgi:hypothetical protein